MAVILKRDILVRLHGLLLPDLTRLVSEYAFPVKTGSCFPHLKLMDSFARVVHRGSFGDLGVGQWMDEITNGAFRRPVQSPFHFKQGDIVLGQDGRPYTPCSVMTEAWFIANDVYFKLLDAYEEKLETTNVSPLPFS